MLMKRIEPGAKSATIRLMRRWVAARAADEAPLPTLVTLAGELGIGAEAAVALASVYQLTEACLGRALVAECCCSPELSRDEEAVLTMLALSPEPALPGGTSEIPHGLPGALAWAIASVRRLVGDRPQAPPERSSGRCPFAWADAVAVDQPSE